MNPFNFINCNYLYDLANYYKYQILNSSFNYLEFDDLIINIQNTDDQIFFFSCLLFPNYFFDGLLDNTEYDKLKKIILYFEKILSECLNIFIGNKYINNINWLK